METSVKAKCLFNVVRVKSGVMLNCTPNPFLNNFEELAEFSFDKFFDMMPRKSDGTLPEGYYFINHATRRGGYLHTDDFNEMLEQLKLRGVIE
jgi:hypothetical protein